MLLVMVFSRFLLPSMAGWDINEKNGTLYVFTAFLAMSRFGLWGFDLSVTQIMQEQVPQEVIGTVNGVQGSLCEMFQIVMYGLTLIITDPADFWILVSAAISNVCLAAVIYNLWYCQEPTAVLPDNETRDVVPEQLSMDETGEDGDSDDDVGVPLTSFPTGEAGGAVEAGTAGTEEDATRERSGTAEEGNRLIEDRGDQ